MSFAVEGMPEDELLELVRSQRWYGAKSLEAVGATALDRARLSERLHGLLVEIRYASGTHDLYQVLLAGDPPTTELISDPVAAEELVRLAGLGAEIPTELGSVSFYSQAPGPGTALPHRARVLGVEQSNSSVVLDEQLIAKVYRRLEAGVNPELELLRFFARHGFAHVPALLGWWSYSGSPLTTTLGILQSFVPNAVDGWTLALEELPEQEPAFLDRLGRLGEVIGAMHAVLANDPGDEAFAPEEPSPEALALLTATIDDEIEQVFERLPDDESVAPIAGCGDAVRGLLGDLATLGPVGKTIRHHGDLHLGQVLLSGGEWFVVDFEGEPARTLPERRMKRSPLRDVAGMLRSFAYAASVSGDEVDEQAARERFLEGYLAAVEPAGILPPWHQAERLIEIFELEKAVYELRYELSHRPDWVHVPVAGIGRLLERASA